MRPIRLEITAFGSYVEKTEIDFTRLQSNLYLITGETGAGKTTIFDAIMFALYGSASGTGRKSEMMHSDAAELSVPTEVRLVFAHQGHEYTVSRFMKFRKKRDTGEYDPKPSISADLAEPDGTIVSGASKVTDRCQELIGLNDEQFRKIVMLAQGEFREFLKADTKDRAAILGKLFDNSAYKRFQALLSGARDQLKSEREEFNRKIQTALENFDKSDMDAETQLLYTYGHSSLVKNLEKLAADDNIKLKELETNRDKLHEKVTSLSQKQGAAKGENDLLDELKRKREYLETLNSKTEDMAAVQEVYNRAEKAVHQVVPAENAKNEADRTVAEANKRIGNLTEKLAEAQKVLDEAKAAAEAQQPNRDEINNLNTAISRINDTMPTYQTIDEKEKAASKAELQAKKAEKATGDAAEKQKEAEGNLQKIKDELKKLENIDGVVSNCQHAAADAEKALTDLKKVKEQLEKLNEKAAEIQCEQKKLEKLTEKAREADNHHHDLYQRFIAGQSGLMAEILTHEIEEKGSASCPVCRTVFLKGGTFTFAVRQEETPSEEEVNAAKEKFDEAEKKRQEQSEQVGSLDTALREKKNHAVQAAKVLLPDCTDWDTLSAPGYITGKLSDFDTAEQNAMKAQIDAEKQQKRRDKLKDQEEQLNGQIDGYRKAVESQTELFNKNNTEAQSARAEIEGLKKGLDYPSKTEAENARTEKVGKLKELQKIVSDADQNLSDANKSFSNISGSLTTEKNNLPELKNKAKLAEETLSKILTDTGFLDIEAAHTALLPVGSEEPEQWLKEQNEILNDYHNDKSNTAKRIGELEKQTAGYHYTNLEDLQKEIDELGQKHKTAVSACTAYSNRATNHRSTAKNVAENQKHLSSTDAIWNRLDRLADLALGAGGIGGKLSFDRYVMGAVFEDILGMANLRLDTMSGGQFELVHSESAVRANAQAGLDIEVLDRLTGKRRKADSLSGGEGFQASLALALGLSDVVQSRAGGTGIDALFIDEGFGSLDEGVLDKAVDVLKQLTNGNRLVGVISHVGRLEESITSKIVVTKPGKSSQVEILN